MLSVDWDIVEVDEQGEPVEPVGSSSGSDPISAREVLRLFRREFPQRTGLLMAVPR